MWVIPTSLQNDVLRVLGYPQNLSNASIQSGYPMYASQYSMYQPYAVLMAKMTYLANAPDEAVTIFGAQHPSFPQYYQSAYASFIIGTPGTINAGVSLQFSVATAQYSVTSVAGDTPSTIAAKVVSALSIDTNVYASSPNNEVSLYSRVPGAQGNGFPIFAVSGDASLTVNGSYSTVGALFGGMDPPGPYLNDSSLLTAVWGYMPIIRILENDLVASRLDLQASRADVVTLRATELPERDALLRRYRRELADRLGVPLDPDIVGNRRRGKTRSI